MPSKTTSVSAYLAELKPDRRKIVQALRKAIKANLDPAIKEGMQYGGIGYFVPHKVYPAGYHCDPKQPLPVAGILSTKGHVGLHMFCIYMDPKARAAFEKDWKATGKKLDMGAACVRIKKLDQVALEVVEKTFAKLTAKGFIKTYESGLKTPRKKKAAKKATKKAAAKKKPAVKKKAAAKKR